MLRAGKECIPDLPRGEETLTGMKSDRNDPPGSPLPHPSQKNDFRQPANL